LSLAPIFSRVDSTHHWICRPGQSPEHVEVGLPIEKHGQPYARGACPIKRGESTCRLALLDLDSHKGETLWPAMAEAAGRVMSELERGGLRPIPFRSSGGHGIHFYMLWEDPQDAHSVRRLLVETLEACGFKNGTGGVAAGEIEIFPKQDSVRPDGAGSMFVLPLAGKSTALDPFFDELPVDMLTWPMSAPVPVRPLTPERTSSPGGADARQARALLADHDPDAPYEDWLRIGMALHHEFGDDGLALWDEWSARGAKYVGTEDLDSHWRSFGHHPNPVTLASLRIERPADAGDFDVVEPDEDFQKIETPGERERFTPIPAHEFAVGRPMGWHVHGVLPAAELAVVYGASGSGKTFFVLDLVSAIARGALWRERKVERGAVVYVCAEGINGFRQRLKAYAHQVGERLEDLDVGVIADGPNMLDREHALMVAKAVVKHGGASVIVIDTLAASMPGGNENSSEDMGKVLAHCKGLHRATGALVILVHHSGKDESKGARGWSGLRAAADAEMEITEYGETRKATITKLKDGDDGIDFGFRLLPVPLDVDGEITSCIVEHCEVADAPKRKAPLTPHQKIVYDAIVDLNLDNRAPIDEAVSAGAEALAHDPQAGRDRRREYAIRHIEALRGRGLLTKEGDELCWI
jgi:hypothetical protein